MSYITQTDLANYEQVAPPVVEKSNFAMSFAILPREEREAMNSVYSFCSYIDDIVDSPTSQSNTIQRKKDRLDWWDMEIEKVYNNEADGPIIQTLSSLINRFSIPKQYFLTLIDGCRKDLFQNRYETFEDLKNYCYGVASVVGLISIEIFGHKYEETKNYAINLGYALQLTNILRDIKADKDNGYIYLPLEDMKRFDYTEADLITETYNENFIELMRFQAKRVREYYHKARQSLQPDERITITAAEIMDAIYFRLLEKIELKDYDVFNNKIRVSNAHKMIIALKQWLSIKMFIKRLKK
jgi:phytoene synthase